MAEGRTCEYLEVSGTEQSEHEVLWCQLRFQSWADPLQAILTPTIEAISEWKRFKEANKHHAWLNLARLNETLSAFEGVVSHRKVTSESERQRGAFHFYAVKAFVETLNHMSAQEPHRTFRHPVHGTITLEDYMKTQALTQELEHIYTAANIYLKTLPNTQ
eukprot:TRINITY_DN3347_c0_g1_i1.p1 TRINITY_DN3347_c0_g1~~TRINITY_DN3347_c0_g1_i1.p1  ORF type:complete len:161 (+),score=18.41 TRINITY_DN3347_c0_g1_i1:339-821(+)